MSKAETYKMTSTRRMLEYALAYCEQGYPGADKIQMLLTEASKYADYISPQYTCENINSITNLFDLFDFSRKPNKIELCGDIPLNTLFIDCPKDFITSKMKYLAKFDRITLVSPSNYTGYLELSCNELYYYISIRMHDLYYFGKLDRALFDNISTLYKLLCCMAKNHTLFGDIIEI